jgi:hypothetical protein
MRSANSQRDLFTRRWRSTVPRPLESVLHIQLVSMLRWCIRPDVIWRHVPNGEHRDPRTAAKLKAMGVLAGSADLEFHWCEVDALGRKCRRCLHLELKRPGGRQTETQAGFALAMRVLGDEYYLVHSIDEALAILDSRGLLRSDRRIEPKSDAWHR